MSNLMVILCLLSVYVLQLAKKVNNAEASWALGAIFDYFHNLNVQ